MRIIQYKSPLTKSEIIMTTMRLFSFLFLIILTAAFALAQPDFSPENLSPVEKSLFNAIQGARKGDRERTVSALKEFSTFKEFDLTSERNLIAFDMATALCHAAGMDKERDEFHQRSIRHAQSVVNMIHRDSMLKMTASHIARSGASGDVLIEMSKSCTHPEVITRVLVLAVLAESKTIPRPTWEDFVSREPREPPEEEPQPDVAATNTAMKQVLDHVVSFEDVELQSTIMDHLIKAFKEEALSPLFLSVVEDHEKLNAGVKQRALSQIKDSNTFFQQRNERLKEISVIVLEARNAAGGLDYLNPRIIDVQSPEYQRASEMLKLAAEKAKELNINDGRGAVLFTIAQTQSMLGDKENAKLTLKMAFDADKKIGASGVVIEEIASLQVNVGEFDVVMQTIESLSPMVSDRVLVQLARRLLADGKLEDAQKTIEKISDEAKREELETRLKNLQPKEI